MYKAVDCCTEQEFKEKIELFRVEWEEFKDSVNVSAPLAPLPVMHIVKENLNDNEWTFEKGRCDEDDEG